MENKEFLQWIYDRMINVHKENPNFDYMIKFKKILDDMNAVNTSAPSMNKTLEDCISPVDEEHVFVSDKYKDYIENAWRESRRLAIEAEKAAQDIFLD